MVAGVADRAFMFGEETGIFAGSGVADATLMFWTEPVILAGVSEVGPLT